MRGSQIIWLFKMELLSGISFLRIQSRIGRWSWYFISSVGFILFQFDMERMIG
jgi:hypothetical protein